MVEKIPNTVLSLSWGHSDPAVCLVKDGSVVALVEEERLSRVKHAFGEFPVRALVECLEIANLQISEIDAISINWDLAKYESGQIKDFYDKINSQGNPTSNTLEWQIKTLHNYTTSTIKKTLSIKFKDIFDDARIPKILSFGHHYIHGWQAVALSGFKSAFALVIDGSGDDLCSSIWDFSPNGVTFVKRAQMPHSLGWFYAAITELLGFNAYDGEHKVMAMAAYGQYDAVFARGMDDILSVDDVGYSLNRKFIHEGNHSFSGRYTDAMLDKLEISPVIARFDFNQRHFNLAFAAQRQLEKAVIAFLGREVITGNKPLCLSGGVALNVTMSSQIQQAIGSKTPIFVNPLASDSGAVLGSALRGASLAFPPLDVTIRTLGLGRKYSEKEILDALNISSLPAQRVLLDYSNVTQLLLEGKIVAWFQGRAEAGPRALGFRSILCDPRNEQALNVLTYDIKHRQPWQPYGVSMQHEYCCDYLSRPIWSENMSIAVPVTTSFAEVAAPVVHKDGTVRPHIVHKELQPQLYALLTAFGKSSGIFALVNTSLNRHGEPIAYSPRDAIAIFSETNIDALVMDNLVVIK